MYGQAYQDMFVFEWWHDFKRKRIGLVCDQKMSGSSEVLSIGHNSWAKVREMDPLPTLLYSLLSVSALRDKPCYAKTFDLQPLAFFSRHYHHHHYHYHYHYHCQRVFTLQILSIHSRTSKRLSIGCGRRSMHGDWPVSNGRIYTNESRHAPFEVFSN